MSFVGESWNTPEHTGDVTGLGVLRVLEAIRENGKRNKLEDIIDERTERWLKRQNQNK